MEDILELVEKVRGGDGVAFEALLSKYDALLKSMAQKYSYMCSTSSRQYDDFMQEGKMAFYNAVLTYKSEIGVTFGAYAKACVKNKLVSCVRAINSQKRQKRSDSKENIDLENPQDALLMRELEKKLFSLAQDCLSAYEKKIFAFYMKGERAKEISLKIGKSERSVNNAIYRIKVKLKQIANDGT